MLKLSLFLYRHKVLYYFLQFTWGILTNIVGACAYVILIKKEHMHVCGAISTKVGRNWGGVSLGMFTFVCNSCFKLTSVSVNTTLVHESGHTYQNAVFGPLNIFIVCIPSAIRYWWKTLITHRFDNYDNIWFERQATQIGVTLFKDNL